jgi:putative oxidoreductase
MTSSQSSVSRYLGLALRIAMGGVFLYAAWTKLREPWLLFAMTIDAYGILPRWAVLAVARTLPWAELALGLLLLSGKWLRVSASAASAILLCFFAILLRSYLKGMQIDCGCFGAGDVISPRTLLRDGGLLAASLTLELLAFRQAPQGVPGDH